MLLTMGQSRLLAFLWLLLFCTTAYLAAQGVSIPGRDVLQLARTIVKQARTNHTLPSSYQLIIGDRAVVTAPMAFEVLARTLILHKTSPVFPQAVTGLRLTLKPYDPKLEPPADQRPTVPVWTPSFLDPLVPNALEFAFRMENTLTIKFTLQDKSKITAAQFVVAMAMMVKEWGETSTITELIGVPGVTAPKVWDDQNNPVPLVEPISLQMVINGIPVQHGADGGEIPIAVRQPFCGTIQLGMVGAGPVASLTLKLDGKPLCTFTGPGTYGQSIDSLRLQDGMHELALLLVDEDGKSFTSTLPMLIQNGRSSTFTPAQTEGDNPGPATNR